MRTIYKSNFGGQIPCTMKKKINVYKTDDINSTFKHKQNLHHTTRETLV